MVQETLSNIVSEPQNRGLDISVIQPVTLVDIDTLILYNGNFQRGEFHLFELLKGYHQRVNFKNVGNELNKHSQNAVEPFALYVENDANNKGIQVDLQLIHEVYKASGYID